MREDGHSLERTASPGDLAECVAVICGDEVVKVRIETFARSGEAAVQRSITEVLDYKCTAGDAMEGLERAPEVAQRVCPEHAHDQGVELPAPGSVGGIVNVDARERRVPPECLVLVAVVAAHARPERGDVVDVEDPDVAHSVLFPRRR